MVYHLIWRLPSDATYLLGDPCFSRASLPPGCLLIKGSSFASFCCPQLSACPPSASLNYLGRRCPRLLRDISLHPVLLLFHIWKIKTTNFDSGHCLHLARIFSFSKEKKEVMYFTPPCQTLVRSARIKYSYGN